MVSRTRLAVILALALLAVALHGQTIDATDSTTPESVYIRARVDVPSTLPMPANWGGKLNTAVVTLDVEVLPDSTIGEVRVVYSTPGLDSLAVAAVRSAPVQPAIRNGVSEASTVSVSFVFEREKAEEKTVSPDSLLARRTRQRNDVATWGRSYEKSRRINENSLPLGVIRENHHLWGSPHMAQPIIRDGFTDRSGPLSPVYRIQMWLPLYSLTNHDDLLRFDTRDYTAAPAWSRACLGMGDYRMTNAVITLRKGEMFRRSTLRVRGDYAAYSGDWPLENETAGDYLLQVADSLFGGALELQFLQLEHDIPTTRLADTTITTMSTVRHHLHEMTALYNWRSLTTGLRHNQEKLAHDGSVYNESTTTFLLGGRREILGQRVAAQLETDAGCNLLTLSLRGGWRGLTWMLWAQDGNDTDLLCRNELRYRIGKLLILHAGYDQTPPQAWNPTTREETRLTGGFTLAVHRLSLTLEGGERGIEQTVLGRTLNDETLFGRLDTRASLVVGPVTASLDAEAEALAEDEILYTPHVQARLRPELLLSLPHDNHIAAGAVLNWSDLYVLPGGAWEDDSLSLDAWLRIGITQSFSIRTDVYNLTNAERLMGRYANPTHVNFALRWTFVN